jgi:hypothetical protein
MMEKNSDYIWIQDAIKEYHRSDVWFYDQIKKGRLKRYGFPGDTRTYLSRAELKDLFQFREKKPNKGE